MAPPIKGQLDFILLLVIVFLSEILGQYDDYPRYPTRYPQNVQNPYNEYGPQLPYNTYSNNDYRATYIYKGRRYGQNSNINNYDQGRPGDPRIRGQDERFTYDRVSFLINVLKFK